ATVAVAPTSTTGLVAAYNFNAGSGTAVADSTSNHNNGTISNATWTTGGMFGSNALSFNGTNAWVTVPDANSLDLTAATTLEAWVKPTSTGSWSDVLMKESSNGLAYALYASDNNGFPNGYVHIGAVDQSVTGGSVLPANTCSHLTATYDGSNISLYVNGNLVGTRPNNGSITTTNGVLRIGGDSIWGEYFSGLIDEVRIYNRALSVSEIRSDMTTPIGGSPETTPPVASMTTTSGSVSGVTTLSAAATDNVAVAGVQFLLNGQPLGAEVTSAPYSLQWNTLTLPNGTYTVSARAR